MLGIKKKTVALDVEGTAGQMIAAAQKQLDIIAPIQSRLNRMVSKERLAEHYWSNSLDIGIRYLESRRDILSDQDIAIANDFLTIAKDTIKVHEANGSKYYLESEKVGMVADNLSSAIRDLDLIVQRSEVRRYLDGASSASSQMESTSMSNDTLARISESVHQASAFVRGMKELR